MSLLARLNEAAIEGWTVEYYRCIDTCIFLETCPDFSCTWVKIIEAEEMTRRGDSYAWEEN